MTARRSQQIVEPVGLMARGQQRPAAARRVEGAPRDGSFLMSAGFLLLVIVVLILLGALPTWPYSRGWGYYPSGGLGLVLLIVIVLLLLGRI
jgi:hypothetical protein